mgnify:CR=1 FL=1
MTIERNYVEGCTRGLVACMALADSSIHTVIWTNKDQVLGASEITTNVYCNSVYLYREGCVICSICFKKLRVREKI